MGDWSSDVCSSDLSAMSSEKEGIMSASRDLYQEVTDKVVAALETAGEWHRPWTEVGLDVLAPRSVDGRAYRGVNVLLLWASAMEHDYSHGLWGTYRAWAAHGAQVRKGEHGTVVTLWKPTDRKASADEAKSGKDRVPFLLLRNYVVFNVEQVDGYELPVVEPVEGPSPVEHADAFFKAVGADVTASFTASTVPVTVSAAV